VSDAPRSRLRTPVSQAPRWQVAVLLGILVVAVTWAVPTTAADRPSRAQAITFDGDVVDPGYEGRWYFTAVRSGTTALAVEWLSRYAGYEVQLPSTRDPLEHLDAYERWGMQVAHRSAWFAAQRIIDGVDPTTTGAIVGAVDAGSPAAAAGLRAGDVITAVDGYPSNVPFLIAGHLHPAGGTLAIEVLRSGERLTLSGAFSPTTPFGATLVGVVPSLDPRPPVRLAAHHVGSSAGLMFTLAYIDALTAGDLTGGRIIAGTGSIDSWVTDAGDIAVNPILGADLKVQGAAWVGATVFFAPAGIDYLDASAAAPPGMTVVEVSTVADAVRWLCANGGRSSVCAPGVNLTPVSATPLIPTALLRH
jgi:PDZ domain-containing secreted protein